MKKCAIGKCVVGFIQNKPVTAENWVKEANAFQLLIQDWNIKTKRYAIPHPGFCEQARFCMHCGHCTEAFHKANPYVRLM